MEVNPVIKDSDDENDSLAGDPPSLGPPQNQAAQDAAVNGNGDTPINHAQSQNGVPVQAEVDFDQFIQSPEALQPQQSSSQQQREERWIPSDGAGGRSIGAVMMEIGLAQRQLVDDDSSYLVPTAPYAEPMPAGLPYGANGMHNGQETAGVESAGLWHGDDLANGINQAGGMLPAAYDPTLQPDGENVSHGNDNANTSLSDHDFYQSNASYNIFDSSKHSADTSTGNPTTRQDNEQATYKSPHRSKSMQATPYSPHDTEPFSSMVSPKLSRAKSDNAGADRCSSASASDELSGPVTIEEPPKKRGRKTKQTSEGQEEPRSHDRGATGQAAKPEKRKPGRPPKTRNDADPSTPT
ncbi:hypothetical protein PHISP_08250, partial [Aspergillus sp. HF37]